MNNLSRVVLLAAAGLLANSTARAASYVYTDLNTGVDVTYGAAINSANVVAAYDSNLITGTPGVLIYNPATKVRLSTQPPPNTTLISVAGINKAGTMLAEFSAPSGQGLYTYSSSKNVDKIIHLPKSFTAPEAVAINDSGAILGFEDDNTGQSHGFLLTGGLATLIDPPGTTDTFPAAINDKGSIAGSFNDNSGNRHGFLLSGGTYTTIDVFPGSQTNVNSIDALNDLTGSYQDGATTAGFLDTDNNFFAESVGVYTAALRWTSNDTVLGIYLDSSFTEHGFIQDDQVDPGTYSTLNFPGASNTTIVAVNEAGNFTGYYLDGSGTKHGFVAVCPTPGPVCTQ